MRVIRHLFGTARREILVIAALGLTGGLCGAGLIAVINNALHNETHRSMLLFFFAAAVLAKMAAGVASSILLVRLTQDTVLRLSMDLCRRIAAAPLRQIETAGSARVLACLTDDISTLAASILAIPHLTVNLAMLLACMAYLAWISPLACLVALAVAAGGAFAYRLLLRRAFKAIEKARAERDLLFRRFRALTDGIKELKMNRLRRDAFLAGEVHSSVDALRAHNLYAIKQYTAADACSQFVFHLLLGILLFALPGLGKMSLETLTAYIFTALYATAPVWAIIGALPTFNRGKVALERLERLAPELSAPDCPSGEDSPVISPHPTIEFRQVEFWYGRNGEGKDFKLGPLDFELRPGELVFVIGGNGSGKSTLVKVLTGLYAPHTGDVLCDGVPVTAENREAYTQLFSAVFSDFFLFDRLLGIGGDNLTEKAAEYLSILQLAHKVSLDGDRLSTIDLSQGQRRRLALLVAYLDDRPIYVLDEWAADQDPVYREIFYRTLLPALKAKGKTIVVVTHDDRYFHLGDRIIKLDYGRIVVSRSLPASPKLPVPA